MKNNATKAMPFILSLLFILITISSPLYGAAAPQIAKRAFPSTVMLVIADSKHQPVSLGSGFSVGSKHVATNMHVIEGGIFGYGKVIGQHGKFEIVGISARDDSHDLVILETSTNVGPALPWSQRKIEIGEEVFAVGNPQGLEGTFSNGIVSGLRNLKNSELIQITAPISPGSSGGPVLDVNGEVIGIAVATYKDGQNLNFAIPVSYLRALIPAIKQASPLNVTNRQRIATSPELGGRITEGVVGHQFLWSNVIPFSGPRNFSFSLKNQLRRGVFDVDCVVIFYDARDEPLDVIKVIFRGAIPPGLAKRVTQGSADQSLVGLAQRIQIRVLNFKVKMVVDF